MEFSHGFSNPMETPRPSVFGQPMTNVSGEVAPPWLHTPPTHMPWRIDQPSLVHFTGGPSGAHINDGFCANLHYAHVKRKIDPEAEIMPSPKLHITEDKMAAHMSQLRISPTYTPLPDPLMDDGMSVISCSSRDEDSDPGKVREKQEFRRLFVCDEIRRLKSDLNILPSALFARIERPSMALVLWRPPTGILGLPLENAVVAAAARGVPGAEDVEEGDNNNSTLLDLNTIVRPTPCGFDQQPSTTRPEPEAMDL